MKAREKLATMVSPALLGILDEYVADRVRDELAAQAAAVRGRRWVSVAEAADLEGCSVEAMRMRLARGRYAMKHVGRSVLVSVASLDGQPVGRA